MDFRGVCIPVWGSDFMVAADSIRRAPRLNASWVQFVVHYYVDSATPYIGDPIKRTNNTASHSSLVSAIRLAHGLGLKVMLKPHVDWTRGGWRGNIYFRDSQAQADWALWYHSLLQIYAAIALEEGVEALCLGCEFYDLNKEPSMAETWLKLIDTVRAEGYTGLLTYAANWGYGQDAEYNRPGLAGVLEQLDFVGVDGYYPISPNQAPSLTELQTSWLCAANPWYPVQQQDHHAELEALHRRTGKRIVFTEIGYPATDYAARNPGGEPEASWQPNEPLQANCWRAVFDTWANVPWFGGLFAWQAGPLQNSHQLLFRPAGEVVQKRYAKLTSAEGSNS